MNGLPPPHIIEALGPFDLDPCAPKVRPWPMAKKHYTVDDNGLYQPWEGRVWCNPPYGPHTKKWVAKCIEHQNVILLIFARVGTHMFHDWLFRRSTGMFFFRGRLAFHKADGQRANNSGADSVLVAFDPPNADRLQHCNLNGTFIPLNR